MSDVGNTTVIPKVKLELTEASPELEKLFEDLSKAQGEMQPAVLDMVNPHYKSKYASIGSCKASYQSTLSKYGFCLTQQVYSDAIGYYVRTMLGHKSGQWMANTFQLLVGKNDMQGLGSAITYARRYGANSLIGIVDTEDDDGNGASDKKPQSKPTQAQKKPLENHAPKGAPSKMDQLLELAENNMIPNDELKKIISEVLGGAKKTLSPDEIKRVMDHINSKLNK